MESSPNYARPDFSDLPHLAQRITVHLVVAGYFRHGDDEAEAVAWYAIGRAWVQFDPERKTLFSTFAILIAKRKAYDVRVRQRLRVSDVSSDEIDRAFERAVDDSRSDPEEVEVIDAMKRIIQELPNGNEKAVAELMLAGYAPCEVSERLGLEIRLVYRLGFVVRQRLELPSKGSVSIPIDANVR